MAVMRVAEYPRIVRDSRILGGAPIIRGTRVPIRAVAFVWRASGERSRVVRAYPSLAAQDIDEAIRYYEANRAEIDAELADEQGDCD
jgi:uncharacterized protein (DUF433 family)